MIDEEKRYKELLKKVEEMKENIMYSLNVLDYNEQTTKRTTVYPMARVEPFVVEGYPVFQFAYEGLIPTYKENDLEYLSMIRHYYYRATLDAYDYTKFNKPVMNEVVLIMVQYFENEMIRDLDNRNKKQIQDAIRQTGLFGSDSWNNLWNFDIGFLDEEKNHVQVYVVEKDNFGSFYQFLMKNHKQ